MSKTFKGPGWPDARGWIGIGVFAMSAMLLWMMRIRELREDEFFQTIATVVIANGLMAVVGWAYQATKAGGELAERNATLVEKAAEAVVTPALPPTGEPQEVKVINTPDEPVPTDTTPPAGSADEELPEYAR